MASGDGKPSRQDEAAAWFAAERAGVMLAEQRVAFDAWRADPRNQAALDAMRELWEDLAVLKAEKKPTIAAKPSLPRARPKRAIFAALALISATALILTSSLWPASVTIRTAAGEQKAESLADGSLIAVNVASEVSYALESDARSISLREGEAAFVVSPDPSRPFVVRVGDYDVRAVGTAFNVRLRDNTVDVAVSEGRIEICRAGNGGRDVLASLGAGELLRFPASVQAGAFVATPSNISVQQVSEWRLRIVTYEDAAVRDVVEDFNRYFDRKLEVRGNSLLDRHVTVRLRIDNRERALNTLAGLLDARIIKRENAEELVE